MGAQEQLRAMMLEELKKPELAQSIAEAWRGMDLFQGTPDLGPVEKYFDETLMPKIEARQKELVDRTIAESNFVRPDGAAMRYMEKPLSRRQLLRDAGKDEALRHQQRLHDDLYLISQLAPPGIRQSAINLYLEDVEAPEHIRTALTTTTSTGASEWVPTVMSADFYALIQDELVVAPLFPEFTMRGKVVEIPTAVTRTRPYLKTEGSAVTEDAAIVSAKVTFTAVTLGAFRDYTRELDEDSIITMLPLLRGALAESIAYGIDLTILDGDTTGTHMDSDTHALGATDCRKSWIGLRKKALTNTGANADLSTWCLDNFDAIPAAMGKFANPKDLAIIVGNKVWWKMLPTTVDNTTAKNNIFLPGTFGNIGPAGGPNTFTIYLMGVPITYSTLIRENVNAAGVYDGATTTKTLLLVVNKRAWRRATRREVTVEYAASDAASIKAGTATVAASWRGTFMHMEGTGLTTALGYNMA